MEKALKTGTFKIIDDPRNARIVGGFGFLTTDIMGMTFYLEDDSSIPIRSICEIVTLFMAFRLTNSFYTLYFKNKRLINNIFREQIFVRKERELYRVYTDSQTFGSFTINTNAEEVILSVNTKESWAFLWDNQTQSCPAAALCKHLIQATNDLGGFMWLEQGNYNGSLVTRPCYSILTAAGRGVDPLPRDLAEGQEPVYAVLGNIYKRIVEMIPQDVTSSYSADKCVSYLTANGEFEEIKISYEIMLPLTKAYSPVGLPGYIRPLITPDDEKLNFYYGAKDLPEEVPIWELQVWAEQFV